MGFSGQAAAAGVKAGGTYKEAEAQKMSLRANSWIDTQNAKIAEAQASVAITNGQTQEAQSRLREADIFSKQRAAMAANGIDLGEGSATDVLASTRVLADADALQIHDNALRAAWGYQVQATNFRNKSALERAGANSISPAMAAFSSFLGSASSYSWGGGTTSTSSYSSVTSGTGFSGANATAGP